MGSGGGRCSYPLRDRSRRRIGHRHSSPPWGHHERREFPQPKLRVTVPRPVCATWPGDRGRSFRHCGVSGQLPTGGRATSRATSRVAGQQPRRVASADRQLDGYCRGQATRAALLRRLPRAGGHCHGRQRAEPGRPARRLSLPRDARLPGGCARQRHDERRHHLSQCGRAQQCRGLLRDAGSGGAAGIGQRQARGRLGAGRQDRRRRLCRVPWREWHHQDARHPEPRRPGAEIPCDGNDRLQKRRAQERHHEGHGRADQRRQHGRYRLVLRAAKAGPGADPGRRRRERGPGARRRLAPPATEPTVSVAIPPRQAWPARTPSTWPPRCTPTRTARAATPR